jgi:hypothetical protein
MACILQYFFLMLNTYFFTLYYINRKAWKVKCKIQAKSQGKTNNKNNTNNPKHHKIDKEFDDRDFIRVSTHNSRRRPFQSTQVVGTTLTHLVSVVSAGENVPHCFRNLNSL